MNNTSLIGRLTRDPDIRYTTSDKAMAIARYTLAVDRKFKKDGAPTADFIPCLCFGKTAEFVEKHLRKGMKIAVEGRLQSGSYVNKEGTTVYTLDLLVDSHFFCETRTESYHATSATEGEKKFMELPDGVDENLPFN